MFDTSASLPLDGSWFGVDDEGGVEMASEEWMAVVVLVATRVSPKPGDLRSKGSICQDYSLGTIP